MLVSFRHKVAFAHYPKTAGASIHAWFMKSCPDSRYLLPSNPHLPVGASLRALRPHLQRSPTGAIRFACADAMWRLGLRKIRWPDTQWRVLGVLRDPVEMLVSLYEFWRAQPRGPSPQSRAEQFFSCAQRHTFRDFVSAAVIGGCAPKYEDFFDVGGPLWERTTLLRFGSVERDLLQFCTVAGLPTSTELGHLNRAPGTDRELRRYGDEIGSLMDDVHRHFRWYYEQVPTIPPQVRAAERPPAGAPSLLQFAPRGNPRD